MRFLVAAFMAVFSCSATASERVSANMVCVTERAVMSIVEAEMNGGVAEINKVLKPLLMTRQCIIAVLSPFVVELKTMLMKYKSEGGLSEVWETKRGLFVIALNPNDSV